MRTVLTALTLVISAGIPSRVAGCPLSAGLVDYNCNQKHKIVVAGDSVVAGLGDSHNNNKGGYPKRLGNLLSNSTVVNVGVSGHTTRQMLNHLRQQSLRSKIRNADVFILDGGRNDCRDGSSASSSIKNLKRTVRFIRKNIGADVDSPPLVIVATQAPNRNERRHCIENLNRELLKRRSRSLPVRLRFDRLPASILSGDGLHPDSSGYSRMARKALKFINGKAQKLSLRDRPDSDSDGIYDRFESRRYLTDPTIADTDGDSLIDGQEAFTYLTDPLLADTDGGGVNDGQEVADGTDPLDAVDDTN